jgi:hypothetical protein
MKILLAPILRLLPNGKVSAKQYPYWDSIKALLTSEGHTVDTLGQEQPVYPQLETTLKSYDLVISSDSFTQHFTWALGVPTIVLWGMGDPDVFGHAEHTNLLKDRKYIRPDRFQFWWNTPENPESFVLPEEVVKAVKNLKF